MEFVSFCFSMWIEDLDFKKWREGAFGNPRLVTNILMKNLKF